MIEFWIISTPEGKMPIAFNYATTEEAATAMLTRAREEEPTRNYRIGTWEEFEKAQHDYYMKPLTEITEERFYDMLNVLPPHNWSRGERFEFFTMSERLVGSLTSMFVRLGNSYYEKVVDLRDRSTWVTIEEIMKYEQEHASA